MSGPFAYRPKFFGHFIGEPVGPVKNVRHGTVIDASQPLHEQIGPDGPEYDSLRDWFVETTTEPLDEMRGTPLVGLINAYIYRYIHPEITDHDFLSFRAKGDVELCRRFGFDPDAPLSHSQLSRAYWERLDRDARKHLHLRAAQRAVEAARAGFEVNPDAAELVCHHLPEEYCHYPAVDPIVEADTVKVPEGQKKRSSEEVMDFLRQLDLERPEKGTTYSDVDFQKVYNYASVEGIFFEGASQDYDKYETPKSQKSPRGETIRIPVRDLDVEDEEVADGSIETYISDYEGAMERRRALKWDEKFDQINLDLLKHAQEWGMFDRPLVICVDGTPIEHDPQNSDDAPDACVKNRGNPESKWCYEHITIAAVDCRRSFKLGSMMIREWKDMIPAVIQMLEEAKKHVNIGWLLYDAGFDANQLRQYCQQNGIRYNGRAKRREEIMEEIEKNVILEDDDGTPQVALVKNYRNSNRHLYAVKRGQLGLQDWHPGDAAQTSLYDFSEDEDEEKEDPWILFETNSDTLTEENVQGHAMLYRVRWSIETQYRVIKDEFKARTTSISEAMRTFIWKLAMVIYNAWIVLRILVRKRSEKAPISRSVVRAREHSHILKLEYQYARKPR